MAKKKATGKLKKGKKLGSTKTLTAAGRRFYQYD